MKIRPTTVCVLTAMRAVCGAGYEAAQVEGSEKSYARLQWSSTLKTGGWETVRFTPLRAAFVRLVGHGSQEGGWTSIRELKLLAPK